ncbi:MAG: ABC transporter permease [Clostridiales bacterium]|nr:ABC transporter permease [Clostridiales bacterium]
MGKNEASMNNIARELRKEQAAVKRKKFLKNKMAVVGLIITIIAILIGILAPLIANHDPLEMDPINRLKGPTGEFFFGTDKLGRDLFSRVVYGTRYAMLIGVSVAAITAVLGLIIGLYASYYKVLDSILMRICDGLKAIPTTLLALALMAALGASLKNVFISLVIVYTPSIARLARSQALLIKEQTYIEAMKALGAKPSRIIWRHIAPNILSPVIVQASFIFASTIVTEAALSFLGAGVPVPQPSWGNILYDGKEVIFNAPWMICFPGIIMAVTVWGINMFGDGLRDYLDPLTNN